MMKIVNGVVTEMTEDEIAEHEDGLPAIQVFLAPLTARQLRLGLVANGITLDQVEAAIAAIDDAQARAVALIEWQYASQFNRDHPLIAQVAETIGLSDDQIDDMWAVSLAL